MMICLFHARTLGASPYDQVRGAPTVPLPCSPFPSFPATGPESGGFSNSVLVGRFFGTVEDIYLDLQCLPSSAVQPGHPDRILRMYQYVQYTPPYLSEVFQFYSPILG